MNPTRKLLKIKEIAIIAISFILSLVIANFSIGVAIVIGAGIFIGNLSKGVKINNYRKK